MVKYQLQLLLSNKPEALGKLILLIKQARLNLMEANIRRQTDEIMKAQLLIEGREEKVNWLINKLMFFPYFKKVEYISSEAT